MNPFGKIISPGTIRFERLLPGSVEVVWTYLTESEKRGKWLASGEMELFEGGKIELNFVHADLSAVKEVIPSKYKDYEKGHGFSGRVTKCEPPSLLSFTWADDSEVTFKLSQQGEQVLLELTHRRLGDKKGTQVSVASGWHTHLGILIDHLNGMAPKGFWAVHTGMEKEYDNN